MTPFADRKVRRGRFLSVRKFFAQKGAEKANAVLKNSRSRSGAPKDLLMRSSRKFFARKGAEKANAVLEIRKDKADEQRIGKNL